MDGGPQTADGGIDRRPRTADDEMDGGRRYDWLLRLAGMTVNE